MSRTKSYSLACSLVMADVPYAVLLSSIFVSDGCCIVSDGWCHARFGYCSAELCSAEQTYLKLLDRVVTGARFPTGGVFECDIAHRRSVAALCMLYNTRCYAMLPIHSARPVPYVPVWVTRGPLVAHRYILMRPPRCRTSRWCRSFISLSLSLYNDVADPVFDSVGLEGFKSRARCFLTGLSCSLPFSLLLFSISLQLDFSATFDRVSHSGLLFKLKSIGTGGSVQSICRVFLSNCRHKIVVDGATSEWILIF